MNETQASFEATLSNPAISIVLPVYRNADTLRELARGLKDVLERRCLSYEIIFVEDACPENSLAILTQLAQEDSRIAVLALERNIGQHRAVLTGLSYARGNQIVVMDADLQDPPEAIPDLLNKMQEGYAAVFAGRRGVYESRDRLIASRLFKWLLHWVAGTPVDAGLYVAINREMVERLLRLEVSHPFVVAMIGCTRLPLASLPILRRQRAGGRSAYSSLERLKTGLLAIGLALAFRWQPQKYCAQERVPQAEVKAYLGARFDSRSNDRLQVIQERR